MCSTIFVTLRLYFSTQFSAMEYDYLVEPGHEATLEYTFSASEVFAARPFGFVIQLFYKDSVSSIFLLSFTVSAEFNVFVTLNLVTLCNLDHGLSFQDCNLTVDSIFHHFNWELIRQVSGHFEQSALDLSHLNLDEVFQVL